MPQIKSGMDPVKPVASASMITHVVTLFMLADCTAKITKILRRVLFFHDGIINTWT